ncbi:DUF1574 domain-containing protein [Leptospira haakeii]|uniref:DUF1574 domain-containing protein n=1 Tax=Leptospira haakeii TaxID=2023198 RepID=A0ABX4PK56_9LEPT|nr:DUF1574 domain-containing protein [Leptospira haakeii]PKA15428.1 hypothetical protein CH363_14425 [Leptospira haakeii]PKA18862.1 hypothetical protein CH377_15430 [Leptospira haakeii]
MKKNTFLLLPLFVLLISLGLDRLFTLEFFQYYYSNTLSHLNFISKEDLYSDLKEYLKKDPASRKKILVFFGNSRALLLPTRELEKRHPDWMLYNFSVPGGSPDYFLYWIERFKSDGTRPDFVLLDQSLEIYNKTPVLALDEVLIHGLSSEFILRHWTKYSREELSVFISKHLFHTYRDRPKLWRISERMQNSSALAKVYKAAVQEILTALKEEKGSTPRELVNQKHTDEQLVQASETDFSSYLKPYTFHTNMFEMQKDSIRILKEYNVPYATIWVKVARPYFNLYMNRKVETSEGLKTPMEVWKPIVEKFNQETGTAFWNMNEDPNCNCEEFADPGHMSPNCFPVFGDYIFKKLEETYPKTQTK